jgi:hypothetical protein
MSAGTAVVYISEGTVVQKVLAAQSLIQNSFLKRKSLSR